LGRELDCGDGTNGGNHGRRRGNRKWGGEQQ
jgi:hypothetical protein